MQALERYLIDCEQKRRRARDRPSNQVVEELRALLTRFRSLSPDEQELTSSDADTDGDRGPDIEDIGEFTRVN